VAPDLDVEVELLHVRRHFEHQTESKIGRTSPLDGGSLMGSLALPSSMATVLDKQVLLPPCSSS
jgi:hypothetical protein